MVNLWSIWQWRNRILHAEVPSLDKHCAEDSFPGLQRISAQWFRVRLNKIKLDVQVWIRSPICALVNLFVGCWCFAFAAFCSVSVLSFLAPG